MKANIYLLIFSRDSIVYTKSLDYNIYNIYIIYIIYYSYQTIHDKHTEQTDMNTNTQTQKDNSLLWKFVKKLLVLIKINKDFKKNNNIFKLDWFAGWE